MLVFETLQAHQRTSALRAGIELKLFTAIAAGARTPEELAPVCAASAKGLRDVTHHSVPNTPQTVTIALN
jgi:hypothetical protein